MKITLNGQDQDTTATTLADLLDQQGFSGRVATAVNGAFVPAAARAATALSDGDKVEVVAPMQGG